MEVHGTKTKHDLAFDADYQRTSECFRKERTPCVGGCAYRASELL